VRRVTPIIFKFTHVQSVNDDAVDRACNLLFNLARKRMELDNKSTEEYSNVNGRSRSLFNTGGGCQKDEGRADYCLQNVPIQKDSSDKVWWGMENQSEKIDRITKTERK
jgi:hypothetical protein